MAQHLSCPLPDGSFPLFKWNKNEDTTQGFVLRDPAGTPLLFDAAEPPDQLRPK